MADLNHLHLHVRSVDAAKSFYEDMFGMREHVRHGDILFMRDDRGMDLALAPSETAESFPSWFHFGFRLATPEEVKALYAKADEAECVFTRLEEYADFVFFRCADPDGHLIEVYWEPQPQ